VRDDRPFGGPAPPAAMFYYSRDRSGEHPQAHLEEYAGIFQADAYGGYTKLYEANRKPAPLQSPACGSRFNTSWTCSARLFMPRRMSVWPTASHTRRPMGPVSSP